MERKGKGNQDGWYVGFITITEVVMCEERRSILYFDQNPNIIPPIHFFFFFGGAYEMHKRYSKSNSVIKHNTSTHKQEIEIQSRSFHQKKTQHSFRGPSAWWIRNLCMVFPTL